MKKKSNRERYNNSYEIRPPRIIPDITEQIANNININKPKFLGKVEFRLYGGCCNVSGRSAEKFIWHKLNILAMNYMNHYAVNNQSFSKAHFGEGYDDERGRFLCITFKTRRQNDKIIWVRG